MQLFRRLATNIFFKIILAFVALSFVLFGVSEFVLNSPNSWVAKVGNTTIGNSTFTKAMQRDREMILNSSKSEEALKYLESSRFKSDVLGRMVNRIMIEKLHDNFGVEASKKLILEAVAKDRNFRNDKGKFDHEIFKNFLAKHGFDEERYVSEVSNDVTATMVIQTIALSTPINGDLVAEVENFKQEKRFADLLTISAKNLGNIHSAAAEETEKFFEKNKQKYALPEMRRVAYLRFSKKDFVNDLQLSDSEIAAEYEKNKDQFQRPESRNLYHVLFDEETKAKEFLKKLDEVVKSDKSKLKAEFVKMATVTEKRNLKEITLANVTKKDLIPELSEPVFKLNLGEASEAIKSPLGFHIFYVTEVKKSQTIPLVEVKNNIKTKLLEDREGKVLQSKISQIDDLLLTSNSLSEVSKKFGLKLGKDVTINQFGQNEKGEALVEIKDLAEFSENAFSLSKDQTSKIFYAKNSEGFYALKVEEITAAHERKLSEVKSQVAEDLLNKNKSEALYDLAKKVGEEVNANPEKAAQIAAKYKIKFEKNREFPRVVYVNLQNRQVPYKNEFLDELFKLKLGQATPVLRVGEQEFLVGILREIKKSTADSAQLNQANQTSAENFKTEILQEFNSYLLKKNPVKVNEKILGAEKSEK
jgi:peptidyl-prolyl cis-trans isomerase D